MDKEESLQRFEQYLRRRFPDRRTPKDYLSDMRQFMALCSKPWREVTMHDIDAFVEPISGACNSCHTPDGQAPPLHLD